MGGVLRNAQFRRRRFDRAVADLTAADPQFPRVTPYDLRHTAASLAVSAGAHVKSLQRMLGHASAARTLDVHADIFTAAGQEPSDAETQKPPADQGF